MIQLGQCKVICEQTSFIFPLVVIKEGLAVFKVHLVKKNSRIKHRAEGFSQVCSLAVSLVMSLSHDKDLESCLSLSRLPFSQLQGMDWC